MNSSGLKKVNFEKLRFRAGLAWTGGLSNRRNKTAFSNFSAVEVSDGTLDLNLGSFPVILSTSLLFLSE